MKQNKNEPVNTIFIGENVKHMSSLFAHLVKNNFEVLLKGVRNKSSARPYYKIVAPASQHSDVFDKGLQYCIEHNLDNISCCYPNLDFDSVKNIKERELSLTK